MSARAGISADGLWQAAYGNVFLKKAAALGYDVIVIFGSPANYVARGFKSCKKFNVCADNGRYPAAMLVKELVPGALDGRKWVYRDSPVMAFSEEEAQRYDDTLEKLEKKMAALAGGILYFIPFLCRIGQSICRRMRAG